MKLHKKPKIISKKYGIFWQARTQILAWYIAIITGLFVLFLPLINYSVLFQVNLQVRQDIVEELEIFNKFQQYKLSLIKNSDELQLAQLFQEFLTHKFTEDDTFFITIIDGQYYRSNLPPRLKTLAVESPLMQRWLRVKKLRSGEWLTSNPKIDKILYLAQPIIIRGEVKGVLVIAHTTAEEIEKAVNVVIVSKGILLIILILSAIAAWIASGKVLNPLKKLSQTVSSIDESDLERRIPVTGVGEIAQLTERFNQMMERLQKVFRSQRNLLNDASHELRTPITIIQGHLELMGNDPQEQQETLDIVFDELNRMTRLVNSLLLLAKAERFDFLQEETIDIVLFTQEIYNKISKLAPRNWQINNQGQGTFYGDRQLLTQAIINLAHNAVQHTEETDTITLGSKSDATPRRRYAKRYPLGQAQDKGDSVRRMYAHQDSNSQTVSFWIQDTGVGFNPQDKELIFQRFARVGKNRRHSQGQGLGLSIVRAIAQAHKGKVEANSEIGKGATFTLIFPLNKFK